MNHNYFPFWYLAGIISYEEFEDLTKKNKEKELRAYLEKIHETNSNKRTRDSSTTFLDPYEHLDFKPFFESLRDRYEIPICCELYTFSHQDVKAPRPPHIQKHFLINFVKEKVAETEKKSSI